MLRAGLAAGADRAIRVETDNSHIDAHIVAHALSILASRESCSLILMGKQSVDGDGNEDGQRLAGLLPWPQVTCASRIRELADNRLNTER
jgi:electron transfer flavoprotein beta subunit